MSLGGVFMTDTDGNIGVERSSLTEKVCGLLFDISAQTDFWTKGPAADMADSLKDAVIELNSMDDVAALGIKAYTGETEDGISQDFLFGIPFYHIEHFFKLNGGTGRLFVAFADCSTNWNALTAMQQASGGIINQFGVWTEQSLWRETDAAAEKYAMQIVDDIQLVANSMANDLHAPAVVVLNANPAKVKTATGTATSVVFSKIPSCIVDCRYVAVALGQAVDSDVRAMQIALESKTPVGNVGAILGLLASMNVADNIGCVMNCNVGNYFPDIEFGFGDCTLEGETLKNSMRYAALSPKQLDTLDDLGYIFLMKYAGREGQIFFNGDATCSDGDYRSISRNRVMNKSRRSVRQVLLPYVNYKIKVDPATGQLSAAHITMFQNLVNDVLQAMVDNEEVSGIGAITIPASQNILKNDKLILKYSLIPMGHSKIIEVTEGFALSQS
jgi:hypothetical protein|nr:MAG TPA: tail sheath protein [Caudoviricetes sp.]DAN45872.1 MAG TPA: tail sheath protein [Caudoviricetes sp.]